MTERQDNLLNALDKTIGPSAKRAQAQEDLRREMARMRKETLDDLKRSWTEDRKGAAAVVEHAIRRYSLAALSCVKNSLEHDARMPLTINHLERYSAMKALQDRKQLLMRLRQTLDLAREAIDRAGFIEVQAGFDDAAVAFRNSLEQLSSVPVRDVEESDENEIAVENWSDKDSSVLDGLIRETDALLPGLPDLLCGSSDGVLDDEEALDRYRKQLDEAVSTAEVKHREVLRRLASAAVGKRIETQGLSEFQEVVTCSLVQDTAALRELYAEVDKSFATYEAVVRDNGLFSAFSEGSSFGRCERRLGWMLGWDDWSMESYGYDEGERYGKADAREPALFSIPTAIEDVDDDGDELSTVVERMREFNRKRYFGMLDDDFKQHVDAFWYGFSKLMDFVNGMVEVDARPFGRYCSRLTDELVARSRGFSVLMDDEQLSDYCEQLRKLRKKMFDD